MRRLRPPHDGCTGQAWAVQARRRASATCRPTTVPELLVRRRSGGGCRTPTARSTSVERRRSARRRWWAWRPVARDERRAGSVQRGSSACSRAVTTRTKARRRRKCAQPCRLDVSIRRTSPVIAVTDSRRPGGRHDRVRRAAAGRRGRVGGRDRGAPPGDLPPAPASSPSCSRSAATASPAAPSSPTRARPRCCAPTPTATRPSPTARTPRRVEQLTGFYVIDTSDLDDLLEVCKVLGKGEGVIEVRECKGGTSS